MKFVKHINILDGNFVHSSTSSPTSCKEMVYLDPSKYSGSCLIYTEIVYTNTSASGSALQWTNIGAPGITLFGNVSTPTLVRSSSLTLSGIASEGFFNISALSSAGTLTIKSCRLVIIQDTGINPLVATESQFEIGNYETGKTNTTIVGLAAPKYYKHVAANRDGTETAYAEVVYQGTGTMYAQTFRLQKSLDLATWTDVVTIVNAATTSTLTIRTRSGSFTLEDGYYYRLAGFISNSMESYSVYCAKIIIEQTESVAINQGTGTSSTSFGLSGGQLTAGQSVTPSADILLSRIRFALSKTGSPTDNIYVEIRSGSFSGTVVGTSANIAGSSLSTSLAFIYFTFPSGITLTSGTTYYIAIRRTGSADSTNRYNYQYTSPSAYADGTEYYSTDGTNWIQRSANDLVFTVYSEISKTQDEALGANTTLAAGTALQNFLVKYDPAEYDGVDVTHIHQVDASDNNTSVVEIDTAAGSQIVGSVVSLPDNVGFSYHEYYTDKSGFRPLDNSIKAIGQSFVGNGKVLDSITLFLSRLNSPTGNIVVKIYAHSGTFGTSSVPTGASLATSGTIDVTTIATSAMPLEFKFTGSNRITLTNSTNYVLVVEYLNGDATNRIGAWADSSSPSHAGNESEYNGSTWSANVSFDLAFGLRSATGLEMPGSSGNLDVKATTNSGNVYASKIISVISKQQGTSAAPGLGELTVTGFAPTVNVSISVSPGLGELIATGFAPQINTLANPGLGELTVTGFTPTVTLIQLISPGLGQLTVTGFEPVVNISHGVGELVLTGFAPTINITNNISASPALGELTITGFAPQANLGIATQLGQLTVTGFEPTISISNNISVSPALGELTVTGFAPQANLGIATQLGELSLTGFAPQINTLANPGLGELTVTGFAPTVNVSNHITVASGLGELIVVGFAPTVSANQAIEVPNGELILTGFAPQINTLANPGLGELTVTGFAPTVSISNNISASPALGELTIISFAPQVNLSIATQLGQLTVTGFEPTINISHGIGELVLTGFAPQANLGIATQLGQLVATGFESTVNVTVSALPGTGQLTVTGFEPTVSNSNDVVVSPNTANLTVTGFTPTPNISHGVGQLVATGFAPTVTASNNISVTPGLGQLTVTGFAPQVNIRIATFTGQLVATGFAPTVNIATGEIQTQTGQLTVTGFAPAVIVSNNISVTPGLGQLTVIGFAPTISLSIATSTGQLIVTGFEPSASISGNVSTGTGELIITGFAPEINDGDKEVYPETGELIVTGFAPTPLHLKGITLPSEITDTLILESEITDTLILESEITDTLILESEIT